MQYSNCTFQNNYKTDRSRLAAQGVDSIIDKTQLPPINKSRMDYTRLVYIATANAADELL